MQKNIAAVVTELIRPLVEGEGYVLWDVEYLKEGARQILRITIDTENGVDINDCEKIHRMLDPVLDEADPIPVAYYLEVSSPGLERELRTAAHFEAFLGSEVHVRFYAPMDGQKERNGVLSAYDAASDTLTLDDTPIPHSKIAKCNLVCEF